MGYYQYANLFSEFLEYTRPAMGKALLNTIYFLNLGTIEHNPNNCLSLSGYTSFLHGVHASLVVECSLMRVLLKIIRLPLFII